MSPQPGSRPAPGYALTLLGGVRWHGSAIVGERAATLLATLVLHPRDGATDTMLIEQLWDDTPPANPTKALQVVVSRARAATSTAAIARTTRGYRLGLDSGEVDVLALDRLVDDARARLAAGAAADVLAPAEAAVRLAGCCEAIPHSGAGGAAAEPLRQLRAAAAERGRQARRLLGIALSAIGEHDAALAHLLPALENAPTDEHVLACVLRSEAAARGTACALDRYERYRATLADRLGTDPGPQLRQLHAELLAADRPVRGGIRFDATELLGRDGDIKRLRALLRVSRIVSIVGVGGLGKTRLAHVIGHDAEQPVVRMVELVGVTAPEDIVGELGSALGVRDSVTSRRVMTPQQRADLRSRIAAQLGRVPTLLILDNCEQVIHAVAELVAFLVASTRSLRVLATSRAPLNIAGERVYALDQLGTEHAVELFRQRALAARPGAALPEDAVTEVVQRLDGLPLAIELAAVKMRVMAVEDIVARLGNRFALLHGGDRSAPDRHQTLLAVIDWSWNLLAEQDRAALRWLSVFHDGFSLPAAEFLLGSGALDAVHHLADQSLVTVRDTVAGVRYGMLETVREFGRMQLVDAGEEADARAAQRRWAREYAGRASAALFSPDQIAMIDLLRAEETNLADVLRQALAEPDPDTVVILLAALTGYWTVTGQHERLLVLADAIEHALAGWTPRPELVDDARTALNAMANTQFMLGGNEDEGSVVWRLLRELGPGSRRPEIAALTTVTLACDPARGDRRSRLLALCEEPDRLTAAHALLATAHELENAGDPAAAISRIERALAQFAGGVGPWLPAMLQARLAAMNAQLGRHSEAADQAGAVWPVLARLDALDDVVDMRALVAMAALTAGRLDDADREIDEIQQLMRGRSPAWGSIIVGTITADLALARGRRGEGLRQYRDAVRDVRELRIPGSSQPTGTEPWSLFVHSAALCAHALYATGDDGSDLFGSLAGAIAAVLDSGGHRSVGGEFLDYPVTGTGLYSLALWGLLREALPVDWAVRLAVLADRFGYNRMLPTMAWSNAAMPAERVAPGLLARIDAEYGDRRGGQLLGDARGIAEQLLQTGPLQLSPEA